MGNPHKPDDACGQLNKRSAARSVCGVPERCACRDFLNRQNTLLSLGLTEVFRGELLIEINMGLSKASHTSRCCCCAPRLCGLRGGILAFSILQITFGSLSFVLGMISSMPWHRLMERGELQPGRYIGTTTDYASYVHFLFVPFGIWAITVGFFGVRATCPSSHVLSLADTTLYNARMLFSATACQTAAHSLLLFALAIWLSAAMLQEA